MGRDEIWQSKPTYSRPIVGSSAALLHFERRIIHRLYAFALKTAMQNLKPQAPNDRSPQHSADHSAQHRPARRAALATLAKLTAVAIGGMGAMGIAGQAWAKTPLVNIEVWKDPNCGCCKDWISHLQARGFEVKVYDTGNNAARARLGMPAKFGSCHTALVQGYVIEGHVPAADIHRLLKDKTPAIGLSVPGMPVGSPGMDGPEYGGRRDRYDVVLVQKNGEGRVFNSYK
jgi:hypothetical protein